MIFVTGGAGFIGSNFVLDWLGQPGDGLINFDKLTYAGKPDNLAALEDDPRPRFVRGDICAQVRDWLYVGDHGAAIRPMLEAGVPGDVYKVGGGNEAANIDVERTLCDIHDDATPKRGGVYSAQGALVPGRPGHYRRYLVDTTKNVRALGWRPIETFDTGLRKTVQWYPEHLGWVSAPRSGTYRARIEQNHATPEAS